VVNVVSLSLDAAVNLPASMKLPGLCGLSAFLVQDIKLMFDLLFFVFQGFYFSAGIDDCTVILTSKDGTDLGKRIVKQFSAQIHGGLPGKDNVLPACCGKYA
jgi:hypothetical protein